MIFVDFCILLESIAVQFCGESEHALYGVVQLKIWLHVLLVEGIAVVLQLLEPEGIIPGHELEIGALGLACVVLQLVYFLAHRLGVILVQTAQEFHYGLGSLGHGVLQLILGEVLFAHQLGDLQADVGDILQDKRVVVRSPGVGGSVQVVQFMAQVAVGAVHHEGSVAGTVDGDEVE